MQPPRQPVFASNGVNHGPKILERRIQLDMMRWRDDESAVVANGLQPLQDLLTHLLWGAEGERMLFVNRAPKTELISILALQLRGIHAGRLYGVKHIQSDL